MRRSLTLAALLLAGASSALADRVHLKNGRVLEGEVTDKGDALEVRSKNGITASIPKDQVVRIEEAVTPEAALAARRAALPPDDLQAHLRLARDYDKARLEAEARSLREELLGRWPDDGVTRQALGYVRLPGPGGDGRWLTREEYMAGLGLVAADGGRTWVTQEEGARRERAEQAKAEAAEVRALLRAAATADDVAPIASRLVAFQDDAAVPVLAAHVGDDSLKVRALAIDELGRRRAVSAARRLAEAVVDEPRRVVREKALSALDVAARTVDDREKVGRFLVRALGRENPFQRVHAAAGLMVFPVASALPALVMRLRESTAGFGRVSMSVITQRSYIADFELSSGGTGNVVAEVADPIIANFTEGTVLDVQVVQWERNVVVTVLQRLSGQRFGADPDAWEDWLRSR
jgi:hypothetical protein